MRIEEKLLPKVYNEMWNACKIGLSDAEHYISILMNENYFQYDLKQESEIADFIKKIVGPYFFPSGFDRRKVYEISQLAGKNVVLKEIGEIPDGWDCKLYFDSNHNLYWEDNYGRYSIEGVKISPFMDPMKKYKMSR